MLPFCFGGDKMIDIHTHILPNVDDGSSSVELSLAMLEEEIKQGVTDVYLTPHVCYGNKQYYEKDELRKIFEKFKDVCKKLPINLHLGEEIFYRSGSYEAFKQDKFLPLGDTEYYLVEFSMAQDFEDIESTVYNLTCLGKKIIVAHPERYSYMKEELMDKLKEVGAYFQVNTSSFYGVFGRHTKKRAKKLLKKGYIDFLSSDCHDMKTRKPNLLDTMKYIEKKYKIRILNKF